MKMLQDFSLEPTFEAPQPIEALASSYVHVERLQTRAGAHRSTEFAAIDALLGGGFREGGLYFLHGAEYATGNTLAQRIAKRMDAWTVGFCRESWSIEDLFKTWRDRNPRVVVLEGMRRATCAGTEGSSCSDFAFRFHTNLHVLAARRERFALRATVLVVDYLGPYREEVDHFFDGVLDLEDPMARVFRQSEKYRKMTDAQRAKRKITLTCVKNEQGKSGERVEMTRTKDGVLEF